MAAATEWHSSMLLPKVLANAGRFLPQDAQKKSSAEADGGFRTADLADFFIAASRTDAIFRPRLYGMPVVMRIPLTKRLDLRRTAVF